MEPARSVEARWRRPTRGWSTVLPALLPAKAAPVDEELPPTARIAAQSERACRNSIIEAADLTASHVDLEALTGAVARQSELDIDRLLLPGLFATLLQQRLHPRFETVFRHGVDYGAGVLRQRGIAVKQLPVDLSEPYRQAAIWTRSHAANLIRDITEQQREAVRRLIARAVIEDIPPADVARQLRRTIGLRPDQVEAVQRFTARLRRQGVDSAAIRTRTDLYRAAHLRQRSMLIARTELVTAVNAGQLSVWSQAVSIGALPRTIRKQWLVTEDERLCPVCENIGAMPPILWNAPFTGAGLLAPPAHPACRCSIGLVG